MIGHYRSRLLPTVPAILFTALAALAYDAGSFKEPDGGMPAGAKNLFLRAGTSASTTWSKQTPDRAVNGDCRVNDHWAGPPIPAWHQLELAQPARFNTIRMVTWWNGKRVYQYAIDVSIDGEIWRTVVDETANKQSATAAGRTFSFDTVTAQYVRTRFTDNSEDNERGGHIVEIEGYLLGNAGGDAERSKPDLAGCVGSIDRRYPRTGRPETSDGRAWSATAWRGERVHGQFVLHSKGGADNVRLAADALQGPDGAVIPASALETFFVRYTVGEGQLLGDILEPADYVNMTPGTSRPVWLQINVPADAKTGAYRGRLTATTTGSPPVTFDLSVEVLGHTLPPPSRWSFHLDLWQHPWAVARIHNLEPWSDAHWKKMREVLTVAADAGQKCLTISLVDRPWGQQTFDAFGPMVKPTRRKDGSWSYDYSLFDRYVAFGLSCGIDAQINCYSMVPWGNMFYFQDEASGQYTHLKAAPGSKEYREFWAPFLKAFAAHLKEKGWFDITTIAMDERHLHDMKAMIALVDEVSPDFKITLAANKNLESIIDRIHDYCFAIKFKPNRDLNRRRSAAGKKTTYYVCCAPRKPNTFPFSPPAESTWLGWRAAAESYDGVLRWALCSYTRDPFATTDYPRRKWPTGDCYLIYPGPRSSIRFERLREGIQDYEKVRALRATLAAKGEQGKAAAKELDAILSNVKHGDYTAIVKRAKQSFADLARRMQ